MCCLCVPLNMLSQLLLLCSGASMSCLTLVNLASIHLICLHLSYRQFFCPSLKQAHWTEKVWNRVPFDSFKSLNMTINFFTIPLCFLIDQFSLLLSLGFNWYPGMENSLTLSEQPSALRKLASFACKISNCLDLSAVNVAFKFAIIAQFGMSLFYMMLM